MRRILLCVAYDGTDFHGWQVQPGRRTVEGELNRALTALLKEEIVVIGASRTDAGVHAKGNLAVFDCNSQIPETRFALALNTLLPDDVKIQYSKEVAENFHPRHVASRKTYEYHIYSSEVPNPLKRRYAYCINRMPELVLMREAGKHLVGEHDFKSFCCVRTQAESTVRTIYSLDCLLENEEIVIRVQGNGFLYNMVRIIAGTLLEVGYGKISTEHVKEILDKMDRCAAGPTAPPEGLILCKIDWSDEILADKPEEMHKI